MPKKRKSHPCHRYVRKLKERFESDTMSIVWGNFHAKNGSVQAMSKWLDLIDSGKTIISCETPVIGRDHFEQCDRVEPYFSIGIFNSSTLHRGGFVIPPEATDARLTSILTNVHEFMSEARSDGDSVLYALQSPGDTSLQGVDVETAAIYDLTHLVRITDRPVFAVRHPYTAKTADVVTKFCRHRGIQIVNGPARKFFDRTFCTVSHSSSTAIDGILAGVPAVTLNPASFARPCSVHRLDDLEQTTLDGCRDWLCRLAFTQWQPLTEIDEALDHLQA